MYLVRIIQQYRLVFRSWEYKIEHILLLHLHQVSRSKINNKLNVNAFDKKYNSSENFQVVNTLMDSICDSLCTLA